MGQREQNRWEGFILGALGVGLWLFGDEVVMPLSGLAKGPTAYPMELHAHAFGAHVAYGLATAAATQALQQLTSLSEEEVRKSQRIHTSSFILHTLKRWTRT